MSAETIGLVYTLVHVVLLVSACVFIAKEVGRYLSGRWAPDYAGPPRPNMLRTVVFAGVSLITGLTVLVVNMSCLLGCVGGSLGRMIDWVSLLPMIVFVYFLLRCAAAAYWHSRHRVRR